MTAEEIRKQWNIEGKYPPEMMSDFALIEIAAQLADLVIETKRSRVAQEYIADKLKECTSDGCFDITRRDP